MKISKGGPLALEQCIVPLSLCLKKTTFLSYPLEGLASLYLCKYNYAHYVPHWKYTELLRYQERSYDKVGGSWWDPGHEHA